MLKLLTELFGSDFIRRMIGTRTNVAKPIRMDYNSPYKLYSDDAFENPKSLAIIEEKIAEYAPYAMSNRNASEIANYEMNMRRLKNAKMKQAGVTEGMVIRSDLMKMTDDDLNALAKEGEALQAKRILTGDDRERLKYINNLLEEAQKLPETGKGLAEDIKAAGGKPEAKIFDIGTKKKVSEEGIMSLKDELGLPEGIDPKSERGKLIMELQRSTAGSKKAESTAKKVVESMFGPLGRGAQKDVMQEGRRRAVIRQILLRDDKIDLPENVRESLENLSDLQKGADQSMDPLNLLDQYYKRDIGKLEELDEIIDTAPNAVDAADTFIVRGGLDVSEDLGSKLKKADDDPDMPEMAEGGRILSPEEYFKEKGKRNKSRDYEKMRQEYEEYLYRQKYGPRDEAAKGGLSNILGV